MKSDNGNNGGKSKYSVEPVPRWDTIGGAADYLGVSHKTIRLMVKQGELRAYRHFNRDRIIRIDLNDIDRMMGKIPRE